MSDAFEVPIASAGYEWSAMMYNLNHPDNAEMIYSCRPLLDYVTFLDRIKKNQGNGMKLEDAVDTAVQSCIKDNIMSEFFMKHRSEVSMSILTEFDEEKFVKYIREEGQEAGEKRLATLLGLLQKANRMDDLQMAISDVDSRQRLYEEFGL